MSHVLTKLLVHLCRAFGLPDWAALFVLVPILLAGGLMAVLVRRKYFQVMNRKLKPYKGRMHHGLLFWRPTAVFEVDGVRGRMPWVSYLTNMTRIHFDRLGSAGKLVVDSQPLSGSDREKCREEPKIEDRIFNARFQVAASPAAFGAAFLDAEMRKRLIALLQMSREILGRGEENTPKGRFRLEIDGRSMHLELKGLLGTPEAGIFLSEAADLVLRVKELSDPSGGLS